MERIADFIIHIDKYLVAIVNQYGFLSYAIIFFVIFAETGLVVTPFLPGDSLIFAIGALASRGGFNIWLAYIVLLFAAVGGDACNYLIGHKLGRKAFKGNFLFKEESLEKTEDFYKRHGGKTIVMARFIPIIRTFAPFVAGVCKMEYSKFFRYNVVGAWLWVTSFLFLGYFFGNLPWVEENFTYAVFAIIFISVLPAVYHYLSGRTKRKKVEGTKKNS